MLGSAIGPFSLSVAACNGSGAGAVGALKFYEALKIAEGQLKRQRALRGFEV